MSRQLYLECYSGISGDMTVAALVDLGVNQESLLQALSTIPVSGYQVKISRVKKRGLDACDFDVVLDAEHENHDHDMEYLYGHLHGHEQGEHLHDQHHDQHHEHEHDHVHEEHVHEHSFHEYDCTQGCDHDHMNHEHNHHEHTHGNHHGHHHEHRGLPEILAIIDKTQISDHAKEIASRIFQILAQAEAKAHGVPVEQIHFHEVGAVDSIVDIIAVAYCVDALDISEVIVPVLYEGIGTVRCQHGILPVPVPAVANIAVAYGLKLHLTPDSGEYVTPTGAAIVAALRTGENLPEEYRIEAIGLGAGKRETSRSGILRAMLLL